MVGDNVIARLIPVARKRGWDVVKRVGVIGNREVYQLKSSAIPSGAKVGYPHLFFADADAATELSFDEVRQVIRQELFQRGGDSLQKLPIDK